MATFKIPTQEKKFSQVNSGETLGNLYASSNLDLVSNRGKLRVSPRLKQKLNSTTNSNLGSVPSAFIRFNSKYWALAGKVFNTGTDNPDGTWSLDNSTSSPNPGANGDMVAFDDVLLVSTSDDIKVLNPADLLNPTTWTSWWQTAKSKAALTTYPHLMEVASNNRLYVVEAGTKLFYAKTTADGGTATNSGNGTLNISGRNLVITCLRSSSTRMWIGTANLAKGEGELIEWDMSDNSQQFNRAYKVGATAVLSLVIKDDLPYFVTSDGSLKTVSGGSVVKVAHLPIKETEDFLYFDPTFANIDNNFVHPHGMALIDDRISFLVRNIPQRDTTNDLFTEFIDEKLYDTLPSGIWQYDPEIGLYHRYSITLDAAGSLDYGQVVIGAAGALVETKVKECSFLCGASYYTADAVADNVERAIFVDDVRSTLTKRGALITPQMYTGDLAEVWQSLGLVFKPLENAGDKLIVKYRKSKRASLPFQGTVTWTSTTTFTSTRAAFAAAQVGDEVEILTGKGAGSTAHISAITESSGTYTVTLDEAVIPSTGTGKVRVNNWQKFLTISNSNILGYETRNLLDVKTWLQFKLELRGTGNNPELDFIQITSKAQR